MMYFKEAREDACDAAARFAERAVAFVRKQNDLTEAQAKLAGAMVIASAIEYSSSSHEQDALFVGKKLEALGSDLVMGLRDLANAMPSDSSIDYTSSIESAASDIASAVSDLATATHNAAGMIDMVSSSISSVARAIRSDD